MNLKPNKGRNIRKGFIALFLILWIVSTHNTIPTFASNSLIYPPDDIRTDMLNIAELYASSLDGNCNRYDISR
jgi:hypothetical protein